MAGRSEEVIVAAEETVDRGSANIFASISCAEAEEGQTKLRLAHAINDLLARKRITQVTAANRLGIAQPKVSALANLKLDGFSVERLMMLLTALDQDVEIVIRTKPRSRPAGRISVVAAARGG
jgi:predicted XRE-type DNA-binding protein